MTFRATAILALFSLSFTGCDEGGGDPNNDFRDGTDCLKTGTTTTTKLVVKGMDPDWVLMEKPEMIEAFAPEQVDELIIAATSMQRGMDNTCKEICDREDLSWTGDFCVGGRDYTLGEIESYETEEGEPRFKLDVDTGKTEPGCVCQ